MSEEKELPAQDIEVVPQPKKKTKPVAKGIGPTKPSGRGNGKYLKKDKIGQPTIGRSTNYVSRVGLGNLTVVDANGYNEPESN